jgi:hypothetical protein
MFSLVACAFAATAVGCVMYAYIMGEIEEQKWSG